MGRRLRTRSIAAKVVGTVWSTKKTPDLEGVRFLIVHPYDLDKEPTRNIVVVADRLGATRTPESFVLDKQRVVRYRGRIDDQYAALGKRRTVVTAHDLGDALEAILAGEAVNEPRTGAVGCLIPLPRRGE